ncbi:hypothetical protein [Nocardiopsis kunsanensis]|uniref:Uncharacterized protein n=1 Tax=Nocardiopsis kunsanensis TaxID=141693 RepID=A0A919CJD9_9ACTN|nr:hypothetical protein [Nocardiopsis kunsanensis]GHD28104.1 hypothetical protein GCM10007147_27770 [Nocardiopsis kunsanensis]
MSLMFMMVVLLGAIAVLGGGSYALRMVVARVEQGRRSPGGGRRPTAAPEGQVGGYVPAAPSEERLPASVRHRALALVADGRREEAVRMVADRLRADHARARRIVADLGDPDVAGDPAAE